MSELVKIKTEDYELTIWAVESTISVRRKAYAATLNRKSTAAQMYPNFDTYVPPAIELPDRTKVQPESKLNQPYFFENTEYLFKWVFRVAVDKVKISHKSRSINDAFWFDTVADVNILAGSINTRNDLGWLHLPLSYQKDSNIIKHILSFEVLPTKMLLHKDLPSMYDDLDREYPLWRFSLVEKTEQNASKGHQRGYFPLMWLANFKYLRERFEHGLKVITAAPHKRLQSNTIYLKADRLKGRLSNKLIEQVKQNNANGSFDKHYMVDNKTLSADTIENRFIKHVVQHSKNQLARFEQRLRQNNLSPDKQRFSESFLDELKGWQQPLQKTLQQSFLKDVGEFTGLRRESLVLQQKTGYSTVYRVWQELKFYLDLFAKQSTISMKSVAEIYEVWCFLRIKYILEERLGFDLKVSNKSSLKLNNLFEMQLEDGLAGGFEFKRSDGVSAVLAHEPIFTKNSVKIRSYTVSQKPDIVLRVDVPATDVAAAQRFIWVFDAKYRIKSQKDSLFDDEVDLDKTDLAPDDAINQMHRYRDALIQLEHVKNKDHMQDLNKSRPVIGAFALYPGFFKQRVESNYYSESIEQIGIGAFPVLPGVDGDLWLSEFLVSKIGLNNARKEYKIARNQILAESYYMQEAARIPVHGMQQVLYPDLTMTILLGENRTTEYYASFANGNAQFYHIPAKIFLSKYRQHVVSEIRFLAIAVEQAGNSDYKAITHVWPVKKVTLDLRKNLSAAITGVKQDTLLNLEDEYYLFELGKPLRLQKIIANAPFKFSRKSILLTTLENLNGTVDFNQIKQVYLEAIN